MKNLKNKEEDPLVGWILVFEDFDLESCAETVNFADVFNVVTSADLTVSTRLSMRDAVASFDGPAKGVFFASEVTDLTSLLQ